MFPRTRYIQALANLGWLKIQKIGLKNQIPSLSIVYYIPLACPNEVRFT